MKDGQPAIGVTVNPYLHPDVLTTVFVRRDLKAETFKPHHPDLL